MNFTKDFGWYYINANNKAPAWTGVEYFYNFMPRKEPTVGLVTQEASISQMELRDVVQLSFDGEGWNHSPVGVRLLRRPAMQTTGLSAATTTRPSGSCILPASENW